MFADNMNVSIMTLKMAIRQRKGKDMPLNHKSDIVSQYFAIT